MRDRATRHGVRVRCSRRASVRWVMAWLGLGVAPVVAHAQTPFATRVLDYRPAPGQFVRDSAFNDPARALGPPVGGGTFDGDDTKAVTLGGFGGSITLGFDRRVLDNPRSPLNPHGLDAIVFGNAFWAGNDPNRRWAEPATIEIAIDANGNGLPDDPWFLVPGTHLPDPVSAFEAQTWDDDTGDPTHPPELDAWIPPGETGTWQTWGFRLPREPFETRLILENPNGPFATEEGIAGYADCSPTLILGDLDGDNAVDDASITPDEFYTRPDNPFSVGVDAGAGGGDAFDIAWAVDPVSGNAAELPGFDFIRITCATNAVFGPFGERSTEVAAVADVPGVLKGATPDGRAAPRRIVRP